MKQTNSIAASGTTLPLHPRMAFTLMRVLLVGVLVYCLVTVAGLASFVQNWWLPLVGLAGALVANTTGIGGGVVFVPAFDRLGMAAGDIVGTSLLVQSFGMTMGAMTYLARRSKSPGQGLSTGKYLGIVALTLPFSLLGTMLVLDGGVRPDVPLTSVFKAISLSLAALIVFSELLRDKSLVALSWVRDGPAFIGIGLIGGLFVGWISIGVGELLAVYLLVRGFQARDAVGLAVIVTALTVLSVELANFGQIAADTTVAFWVAAGAILGGFLSPAILDLVGQKRAKYFCVAWIVISALAV